MAARTPAAMIVGQGALTHRRAGGFKKMPLFMDVHHKVDGLTAEAVAGAHARDLEVQEAHGVNYLQYWFDEGSGKVFCLVDAPNAEAAHAVHREAHGLVANEITEVQAGA
jgi:Protein of unknown function (DUF4242)